MQKNHVLIFGGILLFVLLVIIVIFSEIRPPLGYCSGELPYTLFQETGQSIASSDDAFGLLKSRIIDERLITRKIGDDAKPELFVWKEATAINLTNNGNSTVVSGWAYDGFLIDPKGGIYEKVYCQ
ncbi:MAG: hypothetical protein ABH863_03005 [Candidatus Micrarchaeota archaeon]